MKCFLRGRILTMDPACPTAEAVVTDGARIVFVGSTADALTFAGDGAETIDLGGRLLMPGFIDDHVHFVLGGFHVNGIQLRECRSTKEFAERIGEFAARHPGAWITGGTWDHESWDVRKLPHRSMIDPVSAETPVFVQRLDGHTALANSAALRLAGITAATTDPAGGTIERDPGTGEPTGILKDTAMDMVQAVIPPPTAQEIEKAVERALREAHRNGITSIHDVSEVEHVEVYRKLEKEGKLTCRIFSRLPLAGYARLVAEKTRAGSGTEVLSLGSMKAFSDGSLGSNTALFFEPYVNEPSTCGLAMEVLTTGKLRSWALEADRNGLQLSVHAIGDRANHLVLEIFEEIVRVNPPWDRRFRIEHAQHVRPQDLPRFAALGVIVSAQPYHCIDDGWWAASRIGEARCAYTYAFRNFLRAGVRVCFGSDWTVAPLNAILGIYAAVTRRTTDGGYPGGWFPDQKLTVEEAIRCYTINNAYASFEENRKGSITPGKLADMVVLSHDITRMVPEEIGNATVDLTVWNGEVVHER